MAKVFVITGPSGVGKGTLIRTLLERVGELELSVSATTRRPRPGEAHEVDYHFLSDDEFERRVRISLARCNASIRWVSERSGAATAGLGGVLVAGGMGGESTHTNPAGKPRSANSS